MGTMAVMGVTGDTKITWNSDDELEVRRARDKFTELLQKGWKAFVSKDIAGQKKGEQITEFDPTAERLIMVPQMAGG